MRRLVGPCALGTWIAPLLCAESERAAASSCVPNLGRFRGSAPFSFCATCRSDERGLRSASGGVVVDRASLTRWRTGRESGTLCGMDEATVKAMLEKHFASSDPDVAHEMYHGDAVLEFPQSGERFVGVENLREWRSNYPASTKVEFREIRGRDELWVAEVSISYDQGPWNFGVSILELRGDKIARESIYVTEGWEPPEWRAQWRSAP
jgi:hypothetical protein